MISKHVVAVSPPTRSSAGRFHPLPLCFSLSLSTVSRSLSLAYNDIHPSTIPTTVFIIQCMSQTIGLGVSPPPLQCISDRERNTLKHKYTQLLLSSPLLFLDISTSLFRIHSVYGQCLFVQNQPFYRTLEKFFGHQSLLNPFENHHHLINSLFLSLIVSTHTMTTVAQDAQLKQLFSQLFTSRFANLFYLQISIKLISSVKSSNPFRVQKL